MRDVLLCDLGNVLVPLDFARCGARLEALSGLPAEVAFARLRHGPDFLDYERGKLTPEVFFARAAGRLALAPEAALQLEDAWNDMFRLDEEMVRLVERLAARGPVYLWSNTSASHWKVLRPMLPVLAQMKDLHLSFELGATKPDVQFFERAIDRSGLDVGRCVFVDDLEVNLEAARGLGIATVLHRSAAETAGALGALGFHVD
jgi:FMN phosphatase YigB (HAD superfamily)